MEVEHERFGTGKVTVSRAMVSTLKFVVNFYAAGQKTLLMKFARLRIVSKILISAGLVNFNSIHYLKHGNPSSNKPAGFLTKYGHYGISWQAIILF